MRETMRTVVETDIYYGDSCNEHKNHFTTYCDGDMSSDTHTDDIVVKLGDLPAGATISVQYPTCPNCDLAREDTFEHLKGGRMKIIGHAEKCDCGFDWLNWIEEQYS